jgi:Leucine-rich repeat (LRR) protein
VFFNLSNITDLEEIPAWLSYDQEGMSGLDFSHTSLASLNMQRIPRSLQTLNLTDCKLTKLPTEIVELKKLDYILLDNNPALVTTFEQEAFLAQKMRGYERTMRP